LCPSRSPLPACAPVSGPSARWCRE
jgi:hypothetical protein